jgi:hypothetical protein
MSFVEIFRKGLKMLFASVMEKLVYRYKYRIITIGGAAVKRSQDSYN